MYGTIARLKVKPGALEEIKKVEQRKPKGFIRTIVYQLDEDPEELMMVVLFKDKESYFANAKSPDQNREYIKLRSLLKTHPDWFDGEIIYDSQPEMESMPSG